MLKWSYQFNDEVLERAKFYVDEVSNVKHVKNRITCDVRGSNLYYVRLTIKNELVTQLSCTCPYHSNCKHEATLLYYLEDQKKILEHEENHSHTYRGRRHYNEKLENIFKKAQGRDYSMHGYYDLDYIANQLLNVHG